MRINYLSIIDIVAYTVSALLVITLVAAFVASLSIDAPPVTIHKVEPGIHCATTQHGVDCYSVPPDVPTYEEPSEFLL